MATNDKHQILVPRPLLTARRWQEAARTCRYRTGVVKGFSKFPPQFIKYLGLKELILVSKEA